MHAAGLVLVGASVAALLGAEGAVLAARLPAWHNARALWEDVCRQFPRNRVALHNAAVEHLRAGDVAAALARQQQLRRVIAEDTWEPARDPRFESDVAATVTLLEVTRDLTALLAAAPPDDVVSFANDIIAYLAVPRSVRLAEERNNEKGQSQQVRIAHLGTHTVVLSNALAQQALWTLLNTGAVTEPVNEDAVIDAVVFTARDENSVVPLRSLYFQLTNVVLPRRLRHNHNTTKPLQVLSAIVPILDGHV